MWRLLALICVGLLPGCTLTESRKSDQEPYGVGLLGPSAGGITSGRPASQLMAPIRRGETRDRSAYMDMAAAEQPVETASLKQIASVDGGQNVSMNFVDVELQEFVRIVFDEVLKENVIIDSGLKGRITLRTSSPISRTSAMDLVRQALQANGASLTKSGSAYRVAVRSDQKNRRLGESVRVIPLRYIGSDEAKAALASFNQNGLDIAGGPGGRYLIISGASNELDNLEQVIGTLDVDQMQGMSMGLFPLREASAVAVVNELNQMFGKSQDPRGYRSVPITRMNAVLVISPQARLLSESRKWIARLDSADQDGRKIYVYPIQNRRAADVAKILAGILDTGKTQQNERPSQVTAPQLTPAWGGSTKPSSISAPGGAMPTPTSTPEPDLSDLTSSIGGRKSQGPRVSADPSTNAIVVSANVEEWRVVEAALRRLDVMAPQVLIEAIIAEVRLNDSLRHGVRWYFESGKHSVSLTNSETGSLGSVFPGFNYAFGTPQARIVLNALERITDVEIISAPALTVLDNQTARLQVGDQVPIATRASQSVTSPDAPVVNDIELKDTGVILAVTPRVNASGLVMLDIIQEVSDVVPTTTSSLNSPTIRQRRVTSSVAVHSGKEIVLGGLISVSRTKTRDGVPKLMEIPLLGNLFKSDAVNEGGRTELVVILRPTVMGSGRDIQNVTNEIKSRLSVGRGTLYQ